MMTGRRWGFRRGPESETRELIALDGSLEEIRERFGVVKIDADYEPREEIEPTDPVPIVVGRRRERRLLDARWGLFPFWAKDAVHADLHGVIGKPGFDRLIRKQRCIVPGTALATLTEDGRFRRVVRLEPREGGVFGMAGLYEEFVSPSGRLHRAFTIMTVDGRSGPGANRSRMPLLLGEAEADQWLDPGRKMDGAWNVHFHLPDGERWIERTVVRRIERAAQG
jgi:putative SOS response-associated peptidase YedK